MSPDVLAAAISRVVSPEELREALQSPISDEERTQTLELARWFTARYKTPEARLAYVRQAAARWLRRPEAPPSPERGA